MNLEKEPRISDVFALLVRGRRVRDPTKMEQLQAQFVMNYPSTRRFRKSEMPTEDSAQREELFPNHRPDCFSKILGERSSRPRIIK
jgi:hypothetical protein